MDIQDAYEIVSKIGMGIVIGIPLIYFGEKIRKHFKDKKEYLSEEHQEIILRHSEDIRRLALYEVSMEFKMPRLHEEFGYSLENFPFTVSSARLGNFMKKDLLLESRVKEEVEISKARIRAFVDRRKPSIKIN